MFILITTLREENKHICKDKQNVSINQAIISSIRFDYSWCVVISSSKTYLRGKMSIFLTQHYPHLAIKIRYALRMISPFSIRAGPEYNCYIFLSFRFCVLSEKNRLRFISMNSEGQIRKLNHKYPHWMHISVKFSSIYCTARSSLVFILEYVLNVLCRMRW